ncbi:MAG: TonB-dependent receptor [Gammaproteobacteria bacterium]|nr:TonB-dependent receptor [Gammaproteobacteria bacterium]
MRNRPLQYKFRLSALSLAIAATAGIGAPAMAQDTRSSGLEEIVVTAQRREESLQDTPIAITAFTEDKLNDLGVFDMSQVGDFAPNVHIGKQPSSNSNLGITIRGVGIGETSLLADPKVGFYIDGVYMSKTVGGVFDVVDLERIEVLRGPQGTLFGRNSTGGAMNVTTKKPTGELGGKVEASVGNYGYMRYGGSLDLPAMGDLAAKVSYMAMETDGWAKNHYDGLPVQPATKIADDLASEDNEAYRVALRWTPTEALTFDYSYDNTDNKGVPTPYQVTAVKTTRYNGFTTTPFDYQALGGSMYRQMANTVGNPKNRHMDFNLDGVTEEWLKVEGHTFAAAWEVADDLTLKYIYGKRETDSGYESTDLDGGAYTARDLFYGVFAGNNGKVPTPGFHAAIDVGTIDMDSHEIQIIGTAFEEKLNYTGGVFYYEEDVEQVNPQTPTVPIVFVAGQGAFTPDIGQRYDDAGFCPAAYRGGLCVGSQRLPIPGADDPGIPGLSDFEYGQNAKSWAAYAQSTYAITEQFDLTLGIRYTEDEKDAYIYNQDIPGTTVAAPGKADDKWDNVSYLANGNYAITDDISVYLTYATGYNGGGFNARATNLLAFQTPFDKEEVETWELGLKSELLDNRLRLNVAVFTNDYTDIQIAQFEAGSGGASSRIVNAGAGTYEGIEFDIAMVPVDGLTIDLTYGYLDAQFDEYMALNPATNMLEDISNVTTVQQAPENSAALGVQYDFEPFSFGALSARMDMTYKDEVVFHAFQNQYDSADDHTLINGRLSLNDIKLGCCEDGSLRVSLWGKNLMDEEYRQWGIDFASLGWAGNTFGEPRTYGLDVVYNYN